MKNGLPIAYASYRLIWSIVHVSLVLLLGILTLVWLGTDDHGGALFSGLWTGLSDLQRTIANALPFPWGG